MKQTRLKELNNEGYYRDHYALDNSNRIYPAFGLGKVVAQNLQRPAKFNKNKQSFTKALATLSEIEAKPEKEADWAITGGIAQGIGGLGAGIAAAAQTQINNQAVRERNAKRANTASQINSLMGPALSGIGSFNLKNMLTEEEICEWGVCISKESTEQLFKQLIISNKFDIGYYNEPDYNLFVPIRPPQERGVELIISSSLNESSRIDGYIWVEMYDMKGHLAGQRIVPLPLMGVGLKESTAKMAVEDCVGNAYSLKYRPIALWVLESIDNPSAFSIIERENLPESYQKQTFIAAWEANVNAFNESQTASKMKKRARGLAWLILNLTIFCILALIALSISGNL